MNNLANQTTERSRELADQAAHRATSTIESTRQSIDRGLENAQAGVDNLREKIPAKIGQAAGEIERLARLSMERALSGYHSVKDRVDHAGESTVTYVRNQPVKSLLIAAASGAVLMGAISWWARSRSSRNDSFR